MIKLRLLLKALPILAGCAVLSSCSTTGSGAAPMPLVRLSLLPPNVHGRLVARTMTPRYITIHATENCNATADAHARYLYNKGKKSSNRRFGRSGWVTWHYTVDDREIVQHMLPTEQADHADYGGVGDRQSISIEICEFSDPRRQAEALDRAARLAAALADRFHIPSSRIVPHMNWPRYDFKYGKPCPKILLTRDPGVPGGWYKGPKWKRFIQQIERYR